ncbi:hypothetical protein ACF0H5_016008 [Mactra antiquata]
MGCSSSVKSVDGHSRQNRDNNVTTVSLDNANVKVTSAPDPRVDVTSDVTDSVQHSWNYLGKDFQENGLNIFIRIFETKEEIKALFGVENVPINDLKRNAAIRSHGTRFMSAVVGIVESTADDINNKHSEISQLMFALGHQHKEYVGFRPEYFDVFRKAFLWQCEKCMGPYFNDNVLNAWNIVFDIIIQRLQSGYQS